MLDTFTELPRIQPLRQVSSVASGTPQVIGADGRQVEFASIIGEALTGLSDRLRSAEAVSVAGLRGNASTQQVVEQVMAAEQSLQMAIAVRDKIVSAYLEISRMAI